MGLRSRGGGRFDARGVQREIESAFSGKAPQEFRRTIDSVNKALMESMKTQRQVVSEMGKVDKGTKAYKDFQKQLLAANREGRALSRVLSDLDRAYQRMQRSQQAAARASGAGGGGGRGGMGFGVGIGPSAQIPMPGQGAIQTALQSIPFLGMAAAGSLMAASQTYQSRLRFEQARLGAAPFLTGTGAAMAFRARREERLVTPSGLAGAFGRERGTGATRALGRAGLTEAELGAEVRTRRRRTLEAGLGSGIGGAVSSLYESPFVSGLEELTGFGALNREVIERQILSEQRRGGTGAAPTLGAQRQAGAEPSMRGVITNRPFDPQSFVQAGLSMGIAPAQALELAQQMAGGAGRAVGGQEFQQALAVQRTAGVGVQQQGALMQAVRRTGGLGEMQDVADLIGSAVARGLDGSEIGEYLQQQTSFLQEMSQKGINLNIDRLRQAETALTRAGVKGFRSQGIVGGIARGIGEAGFQGPQTAAQLRFMRAMGFTGEGGIEEFARFRMQMQDPGEVAKAIPQFFRQNLGAMRASGAGPETMAMFTQQLAAGIGGRIGPGEARAISRAGLDSAKPGQYDIEEVVRAAQDLTKAAAPSVMAEAGIEAQRVAIGGEVAGAMQDLSRTTNNMAATFMNVLGPALDITAEKLENFTAGLDAATSGLGGPIDPLGYRTRP